MTYFTTEQIAEMICSESIQNQGYVQPYGNYPDGLNLEEYCVSQNRVTRWVQVAINNLTGEIVDFHVSDDEEDSWKVG